jgi:hypothetical protein
MGTTFVNLQVRGRIDLDNDKLLSDCIIKTLSPGWTTIVSENFDVGSIGSVARRLSKKINNAILSIEYFDDSILMMNVFRDGKVITSHITDNGYGYLKKAGNPDKFLSELEFSPDESNYLKAILKCGELSKKVQLLEKFWGVALWIDHRMLIEAGDSSFHYERELHFVEEYMNVIKKVKPIKNQTKVELLMEFEGAVIRNLGHKKYLIGIPPFNYDDYTYQEEYIYAHQTDGRLKALFDAKWLKYGNYEYGDIYAVENYTALFDTHFSLLDNQGQLKVKEVLPADGHPIMILPDGSFVYSNYGPHTIITLYGTDCSKKWELEIGRINGYLQLYNGCFYLHHEDVLKGKSEIIKVSLSGQVISRFEVMVCGGGNWGRFLFNQAGRMYYCCNIYDKDKRITQLFCLTENLELLSTLELDSTSCQGLIDIINHRLFLLLFEEEIVVIDLKTNEIYARRKYEEMAHLMFIDSLGRVIVLKGRSTVEILDSELKDISRHRLKGSIYSWYQNDKNNFILLTGTGGAHEEGGAKQMIIRVYEIS